LLEETHRRIAKKIARELNLGERETFLLESGSVNPDSWANFPHHYGKEAEIIRYILGARQLFLEGDDECYHRLGIALHYIQDRWTLRPRLKDKHTKWEISIEQAPFLSNSQLVKAIKSAFFPTKVEKAYLEFLEKIDGGIESIKCMTDEQIEILSMPPRHSSYLKGFITTPDGYYRIVDPLKARYFRGLGIKTISFALLERPDNWSSPVLDINFAYRICLEVARETFSREYDKGEWYDEETEKHDAEIAAMEAAREAKDEKKFWILIVCFLIFGLIAWYLFLQSATGI